MRAALIYQHASSKRDREIAAPIDERIGRGSDSYGPLMAHDARISRERGALAERPQPLTRAFAVERVTRIELA
jgi:hypothetical protein